MASSCNNILYNVIHTLKHALTHPLVLVLYTTARIGYICGPHLGGKPAGGNETIVHYMSGYRLAELWSYSVLIL